MTKAEADRLLRDALERYRKGDVDAAARVYREVLEVLPDHPAALHYQGLVEHRHGNPTRAIELLRRSIRLDPRDPRAYNHLGQIVLAQKQIPEAIACFRRALEVDSRHTDSINNLANVLGLSGNRAGAIELYRRALELAPRALSSIYNLANALKDDGADEEALLLFQRALEVQPEHVPSRHNLAVLLEQQGRFEEAVQQYEEVRRLQPQHVKSLAALLSLRSHVPDPQTVAEAEERAGAPGISDDDRMTLHRGLARFHDRHGRYDEAFAHFRAAKEATRKRSAPFDERALAAYIDRIIETFPARYFAALPASGSASPKPVFIVGMPRSGTTLTEQILSSHPSVFGAGERQGIPDIVRALQPEYPQRVPRLKPSEVTDFARRYLASVEALAPPSALRITDKLPVNFAHLGLIATLFPNAYVVHCRRDPLDTALSCFFELFRLSRDFTTDLEDIGRYFLQYARLMAHWRKVLPLRMLDQRYEDLIAQPEPAIRALIAHCGLPWNDACLNFQNNGRGVATPSRWQVRQPIYSSSVGRWRHYEGHLEPLRRLLQTSGSE